MSETAKKPYVPKYAQTALGKVRIYFGRGDQPRPGEVTYSNHVQQHSIGFYYKDVAVKIKANKEANYWNFDVDREIRFRSKTVTLYSFYSECRQMTAEEAIKIGEQYAELLLAETKHV